MIRPKQLVHRGVIEAAGFIVDEPLIGAAEARARVLKMWTPGSRVFRFDGAMIFFPATPVRVHVDRAIGAPLIRARNAFIAAPLEEKELAAIAAPKDAIVLVTGGRSIIAETDPEDELDPASWIDLDPFAIVETQPLGELPPPPVIAAPAASVDLRATLRKVPNAAPELDAIRAALRRIDTGSPQSEPRPTTWRAFARALFERIASRAAAWFQQRRTESREAPANASKKPALIAMPRDGAPEPSRWIERLRDRLNNFAARLLRVTRLGHVVGRRQAEYIARMMEMFEKGQLGDALRHAIPLDDMPGEKPSRPSLGVPSPRSSLTISGGRTTGTSRSSLAVGGNLFDDLRKMYRRAFERLEREGRYEEAAFVLAELLQSSEEAVMFLERHGFLQLAAELAESRNLAPGLIVRQWFVAGQNARAVQIARRTGAFADAVLRLERTNPRQAEALRLLWADALADAGDYASAIDALWPVEHARHLAQPWIERAIETGGAAGARMLVRSLVLFPETFARMLERAQALLEDEAYETLAARSALATALIREEATPETRLIARPAARAVMRDASRWSESMTRADWDKLVTMSRDAALKADLPMLPAKSGQIDLHHREHPKSFTIARDDAGTLAIHDLAVLPSGRILVALGEAGTRLLTRDGRTIAHFDHPARHLVLSDHGDRVITAIERGPVVHLTRIDLVRTKATPWCELALAGWADTFDGSVWFVASKSHFKPTHELMALDATTTKQEALWRLGELDVAKIARSKEMMSCLARTAEGGLECWTHELPGLALRRRVPFPLISGREVKLVSALSITPDGLVALAGSAMPLSLQLESSPWQQDTERTLELGESRAFLMIGRTSSAGTNYPGGLPKNAVALSPALSEAWFVLPFSGPSSCSTFLIDAKTGQSCARIELEGAKHAVVRMNGAVLAVADDRGRIVVFEHQHGRIISSLRI